jgi:hypothetical protein
LWLHLHLSLDQVTSELLSCSHDLPLTPKEVHPQVLDISKKDVNVQLILTEKNVRISPERHRVKGNYNKAHN